MLSIPGFILIMGLMDHWVTRSVHWSTIIGFTMRNVLAENLADPPSSKLYQKCLVYVWVWSMFVLVLAFAG